MLELNKRLSLSWSVTAGSGSAALFTPSLGPGLSEAALYLLPDPESQHYDDLWRVLRRPWRPEIRCLKPSSVQDKRGAMFPINSPIPFHFWYLSLGLRPSECPGNRKTVSLPMIPLRYPVMPGRVDDMVYKYSQRQEVMKTGVPASLSSGHEHSG